MLTALFIIIEIFKVMLFLINFMGKLLIISDGIKKAQKWHKIADDKQI